MRLWWTLGMTVLLGLGVAGLGMAAEPESSEAPPAAEDRERAQQLFAESASHYKQGRFARAIELLEQAYELAGEPVLLYNLGRAYEGDGQLEQAIAAYERYLEADAEVADRGALERRIATLKRQIAERQALRQEAEQARRESERAAAQPPVGPSPSPIPWVITGVGAAGVVVGVVFGIVASGREDDANADLVHESATETLDEGRTYATVANVCIIAGSAVALAGLTWGIIDLASSGPGEAESAWQLQLSPFGVGLSGALP